MRAVEIIQLQLNTVNSILHEIAQDVTDAEWSNLALPQVSPLAFVFWHAVRTQDWAVQTVVRGVPEIIADARWQGRGQLATPGIGAGFTAEEAEQLARSITRADLLDYADAVHRAISEWLAQQSDDALDEIPDMATRLAPYSAYQRSDFLAEVQGLFGKPVWRFLGGTSIGHPREHFGEAQLLKQLLRRTAR